MKKKKCNKFRKLRTKSKEQNSCSKSSGKEKCSWFFTAFTIKRNIQKSNSILGKCKAQDFRWIHLGNGLAIKNFFSGAKAYHLVGCELQCPEMRSMDDAWPLAQKHAFSPRKGGIWTLSQYPLSPSEVPVWLKVQLGSKGNGNFVTLQT